MLKRCIIAENRKLHASPIWVIFFVLPLISAGYGTFNYLQNLEILTERWYSLWTQHTLFYSMLFFPAMVSAYAAYLWRLEHLGHNWNLIMAAPVRPFALFAAKLLVVVKLMCFTQVFVYILYLVCGRLFAGFSDWPPVSIVFYLVRGIFGGLAVAAVQLLLAMLIRSFAVPIFLGLVGGIMGMLLGSKGFSLLWPYCLMQQGMNANRSEDMLAAAMGKSGTVEGVAPIFLHQSMPKLDLYGTVDAAICCLDSLNYLTRPADVQRTFQRLHLFIAPGGLLVFDINTVEKLAALDGQVFLDETEDTYCVWRTEYRRGLCTYYVDLFRQQGDGAWDRELEIHRQRAYTVEELTGWLKAAGFTDIRTCGDMVRRSPREGEQRIYFTAIRK